MAWVTTADGIASPKHRPGLTVTYPGLQLKSLELLKEVFPAITRVALLLAPLGKRVTEALWKPNHCMSTIADRARRRTVCT